MLSTFGPRMNTIFRSRWKALWWSAGVLLTAYCSVPSPDQTAQKQDVKAPAAKSHHVDPWAKSKPGQP